MTAAVWLTALCATSFGFGLWRSRTVPIILDDDGLPVGRSREHRDLGWLTVIQLAFIAGVAGCAATVADTAGAAAMVARLFPDATAADTAALRSALGEIVNGWLAVAVVALIIMDGAVTALRAHGFLRRGILAAGTLTGVVAIGVAGAFCLAVWVS